MLVASLWQVEPAAVEPYHPGMPAEPWYKDGLRFACTQCGNCCTGFEGYVWVGEAQIAEIAAYLGKPVEEVRLKHTRPVVRRVSLREVGENHDCTFFDPATRGCRIYPVRPPQCRTWPFWNSNIETPGAWREVQRTCPGAGKGNFFSLEEIEAQAAAFRI
jgi:Fe-S-cluster containining protein